MELLTTVSTRLEAELIKGLLESQEIPCWIKGDDAGGVDPALALVNGIRLFVSAVDLERATQLLASV